MAAREGRSHAAGNCGQQPTQIDELQKEVDAKLAKILNGEQHRQLREQRERGPGGRPADNRPPRDNE